MKKIMCVVIGLVVLCVAGSVKAHAHCDTLDGPVVIDARIALKNKDVTPILKWVDKGSEEKIEEISKDTLEEISQNPNAKEATEMNFFSDLVRIHRTGEGASFEGLKSAGHVEPIVKAADEAIEKGSIDELNNMITEGAEKRFNRVMATIGHKDESVQEGWEYVEAYVDFTHHVEELYNIASKSSSHHEHENDLEEHHEHNVLMTHTEQEVTMNNVFENIPYQEEGMGKRKLVDKKDCLVMQIALQSGQSVPEHKANSNVHLLILKGVLLVNLDGQDNTIVEGGILPVDFRTSMKIINNSQENTTFLIIKTPNPSEME